MTTNREKLNQMSNEELAEILSMSSWSCKYCKYEGSNCHDFACSCHSGILQWLNQECEVEDDMELQWLNQECEVEDDMENN